MVYYTKWLHDVNREAPAPVPPPAPLATKTRRPPSITYVATVAVVSSDHGPFSSRVLTQRDM